MLRSFLSHIQHDTILYAGWVAILVNLFQRFLFNDFEFIGSMMVIIGVNAILGFMIAWKKGRFIDKFMIVLKRIFFYMCILVATHTATSFKVHGNAVELFSWLDIIVYSLIIVREFLSILDKLTLLGFAVPKGLYDRLSKLHNNLNGDETPNNETK